MSGPANPEPGSGEGDDPSSTGSSGVPPRDEPSSDDAALRRHADALADGIEAALGPWVQRCVADRADAWRLGLAAELADAARQAAERAVAEVGPEVRALLATDVDEQRSTPLARLRDAVSYPTEVLAAAGVAEVVRDDFAEQAFPADVYDLAPAAFADLSPALHEPGLVWGAAKAHVILARRRSEGRR